jgi:Ca-activated chloride channel family protein
MSPDQKQEWMRILDAWDPEAGDLPDDLAAALDADPELRARFDARFAPPAAGTLTPGSLPPGLAERVLPARPRRARWPWAVGGALLAATLAAGIGLPALLVVSSYQRELGVVGAPDATLAVDGAPKVLPLSPEESEGERITVREWTRRNAESSPNRMMLIQGPDTRRPTAAPDPMLRSMGYVSDGDARDMELPLADPTRRDGFVHPGVNPFRRTADQPLATFAADVDRGSYTWTRGQLRAGFLPDRASVRPEEFVNALTFDVAPPEDRPFAVQVEASPSPFSDHELLRVTVAARPVAERRPVHLVFLVDTSGSMRGDDRLGLVQRSLSLLVEHLTPEDTVALVTYAGSSGVALPPTRASDRDAILGALGRLEAGGSTAMGQGLDLAYALAEQTRRSGHTTRVIVASDGDANVGITDPAVLTARIREHADRGITLTTLGFGTGNYQDARMEALADDGDGNYFYVDSIDEARHVFVDRLASTLEVVARDVKLQVAWNPAVVAGWRQVGYENRALTAEQFRDDRVDAGEVGAGHVVTALFEVERVPGTTGDLGTVAVRGKPPGPDAPASEWTWRIPAGALQPSVELASRDHRMAVAAAMFAEELRGVSELGLDRIGGLARASVRPGHREDQELVELVDRARALRGR